MLVTVSLQTSQRISLPLGMTAGHSLSSAEPVVVVVVGQPEAEGLPKALGFPDSLRALLSRILGEQVRRTNKSRMLHHDAYASGEVSWDQVRLTLTAHWALAPG